MPRSNRLCGILSALVPARLLRPMLVGTLMSVSLSACAVSGRRREPVGVTPAQKASHASSIASGPVARVPLASIADTVFWRTLHAGHYDSIPPAMFLLSAAYLQNPRDPQITAHIGFLHAWSVAEGARIVKVPPTITDHLILARTYFARAAALDPADARVQGFHAVFEMSDADVQRDTAAFAAGLARGRAAISAWPEFNWFTVGYTLSGHESASPLFREGLAMQWQTLDACSHTSVDRANPTAAVALAAEATERDPRRQRACWNSWIAPHNVEGFFLNMGDMLVKSGDWRTAVKVYALAQGMSSYPKWAFREVLETRILQAEQNVIAFRRTDSARGSESSIMLRSRFACVACHQK